MLKRFRHIIVSLSLIAAPSVAFAQEVVDEACREVTNEVGDMASELWDSDVTIAWPQDKPVFSAAQGQSQSQVFSVVEYGHTGDKGTAEGTLDSLTVRRYVSNGERIEVTFALKPAKGLVFTPTNIETNMLRFGTDEGRVSINYSINGGRERVLASGLIPRRQYANDKFEETCLTYVRQNVNGVAVADTQTIVFSLVVDGLACHKSLGFGNFTVWGKVRGIPANLPRCTLVTNEGVSVSPAAEDYEAGTSVTLTAQHKFGHKFVNWTDGDGNVIGDAESYSFSIEKDTKITANYKEIKTYELKLDVAGGANDYQVKSDVEPTMVDGRAMYEEGTEVTLVAQPNAITSFEGWALGAAPDEEGREVADASSEAAADSYVDRSLRYKVLMDGDRQLTANFVAADYIAAWDFYREGRRNRPADFASPENRVVNAEDYASGARLVLRDADGDVKSWLDKNASVGGYCGRNAAVAWVKGVPLGTYYWQTCIDASRFKDISLRTAMTYNFNAHTLYNVEYSLNGVVWNKVGSVTMAERKQWVDASFLLPADCDYQTQVYVRWIADTTSAVAGTPSEKDGAALGAVYFTGTPAAQTPLDENASAGVSSVTAAESPDTGYTDDSPDDALDDYLRDYLNNDASPLINFIKEDEREADSYENTEGADAEQTDSGVEQMRMREVKEVLYYDLKGVRLAEPIRGITLKRTVYTDGTAKTERVIRK